MQDKRRRKRYTLDVMEVGGKMMFASEVKIVNISIDGVSVKANRRLNIGSEYLLKLDDKKKVISLKGTVVWSSLSESRKGPGGGLVPIYTVGMKFNNTSVEKTTELLEFIEGHKKEEVPVLTTFIEYCNVVETGNEADTTADKAVDEDISGISQEFIDKAEYLWKWHKTMGYYKVLGIKEYASDHEIKHAFRAMAQQFHPDKLSKVSDDLKHKISEIFVYLTAAHATLIDPELRKEYDMRQSWSGQARQRRK